MWKWIKALNPFAVQLRNTEARLEFARVLLAQAEIELADKAFYVREFAAVSQERDGLKAEIAAIIEATEQDGCDTALEAVKQLREHTDTIEWREAYSDDAFKAMNTELAALRERASVPVGFELDVTADELTAKLWGFFDADKMSNEILDLCRKRIRPVYECRECERRSNMIPQIIADVTAAAAAAARAALEANP